MTDEEYAVTRDRLDGLVDYWKERMPGLGGWSFSCHYHRDLATFIAADDRSHAHNVAATCTADWRYMHANLHFNVSRIAEVMDDDEIDELVAHELSHALVCEMRGQESGGLVSEHEERVVTMIAAALNKTRQLERGAKTAIGEASRLIH